MYNQSLAFTLGKRIFDTFVSELRPCLRVFFEASCSPFLRACDIARVTSINVSITLFPARDIKRRRNIGLRSDQKLSEGRGKAEKAEKGGKMCGETVNLSSRAVGEGERCLRCLIKNDRSRGSHHLVRDGRLSSTRLRRRILRERIDL